MIDSDNNDDDKTINIKVKTVIVRQKKKVLTSVLFQFNFMLIFKKNFFKF